MTDASPDAQDARALLPQAGPMCLLDRIIEAQDTHSICSVDAQAGAFFRDSDGSTPAWLALEFMAQGAAVHGALLARRRGRDPLAGATGPPLLLGSRRLSLQVDRFSPEQQLWVRAEDQRIGRDLVSVQCAILDAAGGPTSAPLVEGRLSIHVPGVRPPAH